MDLGFLSGPRVVPNGSGMANGPKVYLNEPRVVPNEPSVSKWT